VQVIERAAVLMREAQMDTGHHAALSWAPLVASVAASCDSAARLAFHQAVKEAQRSRRLDRRSLSSSEGVNFFRKAMPDM
jgi:hypothetical protein